MPDTTAGQSGRVLGSLPETLFPAAALVFWPLGSPHLVRRVSLLFVSEFLATMPAQRNRGRRARPLLA